MGLEYTAPRHHQKQAKNYYRARPDVGAEMERVRQQRLAVVLVGNSLQPARAPEVDDDRSAHHDESPHAGLDLDGMKEQPLGGLVDDPDAGRQQQPGFDECREVFDFSVAILVLGVGGLVGDANGEVGDGCGHKVEARVCGLGQDSQAAGGNSHDDLQAGDRHRGIDRVQRDGSLL